MIYQSVLATSNKHGDQQLMQKLRTNQYATLITVCSALFLMPSVSFANDDNATAPKAEIRIPIDAELYRHMLATERFLDNKNFLQAELYLEKAQALEVDLPAQFFFFKGQVLSEAQDWKKARLNFEEYILRADKDDKHYVDALEMITNIENIEPNALDELPVKSDLSWEDDTSQDMDNYLAKIKKLYLSKSTKEALVQHINTLLSTVPFVGKRIVSEENREQGLKLSISLTDDGKISIRKTQEKNDSTQIMAFSSSIYGLSREFVASCDHAQFKCAVKHEETLDTWFEIANDETTAQELAQALKALVFAMQKEAAKP
mgnify:CR=1 FL=1